MHQTNEEFWKDFPNRAISMLLLLLVIAGVTVVGRWLGRITGVRPKDTPKEPEDEPKKE